MIVKTEHAPVAKRTDEGLDWRTQVGVESNGGLSVDLARAHERGRGREANTPEEITPRGWGDILWRVFWSISANRILSTAGGVAVFVLLAVLPANAASVSLYGLLTNTT